MKTVGDEKKSAKLSLRKKNEIKNSMFYLHSVDK